MLKNNIQVFDHVDANKFQESYDTCANEFKIETEIEAGWKPFMSQLQCDQVALCESELVYQWLKVWNPFLGFIGKYYKQIIDNFALLSILMSVMNRQWTDQIDASLPGSLKQIVWWNLTNKFRSIYTWGNWRVT